MLAYLRGVRDYNDVIRKGLNLEEFATIGAKYLPVNDLSLYPKMRHIGINPEGYLNRQGVTDDLAWYRSQGLVTQPVDLDTVIDYSFVEGGAGGEARTVPLITSAAVRRAAPSRR